MVEGPEDDLPLPEELPRRSSSNTVIFVVVLCVVLGVVVVGILAGLVVVLIPKSQGTAQKFQDTKVRTIADKLTDMNGLRSMAAAFCFASMDGHAAPLAPDGRVDIYTMLKSLDDTSRDELVRFCFSARAGKGPSAAEFEAGDYTNFPYQRRRGALAGFAPVAWEREPRSGERLVAVSDGSFMVWDEARMQQFFRDNPGQE